MGTGEYTLVNNTHLHDVQREQPDMRIVSDNTSTNLLERTTLLSLTEPEKVTDLLTKFTNLKFRRERVEQFMHYLLYDSTSWWVDMGSEGVLYLTGVTPGANANVSVLFWDGL